VICYSLFYNFNILFFINKKKRKEKKRKEQMSVPSSVLTLEGWCPEDKTNRLFNLVKEIKPQLIV